MKDFLKKAVAIIAVFAMVFCLMSVAPMAASADIAMKLSTTSCAQDGEFTVQVYFPKQYKKVSSLDMSLIYDSKKLEFVSMSQGKDLRKARDKQTNGEVYSEYAGNPGRINWCLAGGNNYEFSGIFSTIVFKVKSYADHGNCDLELKINHASNSGFVDLTDEVQTSGASINLLRNSMNDMEFRLTADGKGYWVTEYNCGTYDTVIFADTYKGLPIIGIDKEAFANHAEIKTLKLPSTLIYVGQESFKGCSGLTDLVIPDNVKMICEGAFYQCDGLKSVSFPVGLETIVRNAFNGCPFLTSIELPFTLKAIGAGAFANCTLLDTVKISKNTVIYGNAFASCSDSMKFITVEGNTRLSEYLGSSKINATVEYVKDISLGTVKAAADQTYTGSAITPSTEVTLTNGEKVELNKDYKLVYRSNTKPGTAKLYVVGTGDYGEGYLTTFKIICNHPEVTKTVSKAATCTAAGIYTVTCKICGAKSTEAIPAKGHTGDGNWVIEKRPTITATGSKYMMCKECKNRAATEVIAKAYPDVNGDKKVNSADALVVLRYSVDLWTNIKTEEQFMNADTNGDGKINSMDALTILRISVGIISL